MKSFGEGRFFFRKASVEKGTKKEGKKPDV